MKYIRIKDGIIKNELVKFYKTDTHKYLIVPNRYPVRQDKVKKYLDYIGVIKKADTIEELCDGYIFKDTIANEIHLAKKGEAGGIFILGASLFTETVRYFIETDKGLIYVAKMNDKGELELL